MKLSKETLTVLKYFSQVNNGIYLTPGNRIKTMSAAKTVFADATIDADIPREAVIYDLSRFLATVSLMDDPDIEFGDNAFSISDKNTTVKYQYALKEFIVYPEKDVKDIPFEVAAEVPYAELQRITKAAGTLGMDAVAFVYDGDEVYMSTANTQDENADTFKIQLDTEDVSVDPFRVILPVANLRLMPEDYRIQITTGQGQVKTKVVKFISEKANYMIVGKTDAKD